MEHQPWLRASAREKRGAKSPHWDWVRHILPQDHLTTLMRRGPQRPRGGSKTRLPLSRVKNLHIVTAGYLKFLYSYGGIPTKKTSRTLLPRLGSSCILKGH